MRYREEIIFFNRAFYFIIGVSIGLFLLFSHVTAVHAVPVILIALALPLLFGRLLITINDNTLQIRFGYTGLIKKDILHSEIKEARVVEYKPIRQFGGWGIRSGRFEGRKTACYSLKGNRGLLLLLNHEVNACLTKTDRIIIGSGSPEKLKSLLGK